MAAPIAALGHLGIRVESSFAAGGAITSWQPFDSEDVQLHRVNIYGDRIQNTEETVGGIESRRSVVGSATFGVSPSNPPEWWEAGLGQSTSPHVSERPLKSMLLQIDRETGAVQASGCMIGTMTFSSAQGEELKCTISIEGKDLASASPGSPSYTASDAPYVHSEAAFKLNDSPNANVTMFSTTIDNKVATDLYGAEKTRVDIPATKLIVTGSFGKIFASVTERNAFLAGTNRSFQVTFTRGAKSFDINVAKMKYDSRPTPLSGQSAYILETFNWTAYVDDADAEESIEITVV